ncbi:hypothetical protein D918_07533 [Trichuris suis]|nr:hypothetical protein D918_07533 [Trichuris suis]
MDQEDSRRPNLLSSETTANGMGLAKSAWKENSVELDSSLTTRRDIEGGAQMGSRSELAVPCLL